MMTRKKNLLLLLLLPALLVAATVRAQGETEKPLIEDALIGKPCPDVELGRILNFPAGKARISDFKGKPLIIDFFTTRCMGCVLSFPKIDSMQKAYGRDVQFLLATYEPEAEVRRLFDRRESLRRLKLATLVEDTALHALFPHRGVPHVVMIDRDGIVRAITYSVEKEDVARLLKRQPLNLAVKKDDLGVDSDLPQVINDYRFFGQHQFYVYTYIGPAIRGTVPVFGKLKNKHLESIKVAGPIEVLYRDAYNFGDDFNKSRVLLEIKDSAEYKATEGKTRKRMYYFEMMVRQPWPDEKVYRYMQQQLDGFFEVHSRLQKRRMPCYVLKKVGNTGKLTSKGGKPYYDRLNGVYHFKNTTWRGLVNFQLNIGKKVPLQVVDETGIEGERRINISLYIDFNDLPAMQRSLKPYGLTIAREEREMEVIVLRDREG